MPNWCYNTLEIKLKDISKKDVYLQLLKKLNIPSKLKFSFNAFIPYPKKYKTPNKKTGKDGYNSGGYEWCCMNWGTKWNAQDVKMVTDNSELGHIKFEYMTAWSPPIQIICKMSQVYPGIKFINLMYYIEEGAGFKGEVQAYNGKIITHKHNKLKFRI